MHILYDYQIFELQKTGGISKYHANIHSSLLDQGIHSQIGLLHAENLHLQEIGFESKNNFTEDDCFFKGIHFRGKRTLQRGMRKLGYPLTNSHEINANYCRELIKSNSFDVFHPTYYHDTYHDISFPCPVVLTIHDMIYESFPTFFPNIHIIQNKKEWAKQSQKIIAISEYTKKEILRYYDFIKEENVHIIYHGIEQEEFFDNTVREDYILYVGERSGYKNFFTLLRALHILKEKKKEIKLYCVGREFTETELLYIDFLNLKNNVTNLGRISDEELTKKYRKAQLYISTSLSEGFGLPLLECMKYATPMLLSDIPVYNEIANNAAMYFPALNEYELADAISYIYDNSTLQRQLTEAGKERCKKFTHEEMISQTIHLYNSLR